MQIRTFDVEISDIEWHELISTVIENIIISSTGTSYYANGSVVYRDVGDVSDGVRLIKRYHNGERTYKLFKELENY